MNVGHLTDGASRVVPDRAALVVGGRTTTYRELETAIRRTAATLAAAGVGPGDRVALVDVAGPLSVATILAAARLGAATAQMNAYLTPGELGRLAESVGARVGVAGAPFAAGLDSVIEGPVLGEPEIDDAGPEYRDPSVGGAEDIALVLFTSGTTGLPKPVAISHGVVADRLAYWTKPIDPDADPAVDMMSVPIFHIGGTLGLFVSLHQGKVLVLLPKFDAGTWLELVERHRVTQTFVVPTMLSRILDHPLFPSTDLSSLRSLSYGAAAAPVDLVRRAIDALPGVDFSNTFGQTETLGAYAALTPDDHRRGDRFGSVGRPLAGVQLRIVDPVSGREVEPGEPGEFQVRADQNTTSDWLPTGDTGWQDDEGYLFLDGRLSDVINRGGEKLGPIEVEEALRSHPAVRDAGVVGVSDPELGERVGAVVVVDRPVSAEELAAHCATVLATYKVPEYFGFTDELPVTVLGKLDRRSLPPLLATDAPVDRPSR
ncbi:MAG: AMP-binding protein [Acidimicrobiales bacterium]|jgi:long-chain acyl-CoA synthetase